jgi:hypothetical protein
MGMLKLQSEVLVSHANIVMSFLYNTRQVSSLLIVPGDLFTKEQVGGEGFEETEKGWHSMGKVIGNKENTNKRFRLVSNMRP